MKKIILLTVVTLILAACAGSTTSTPSASSNPPDNNPPGNSAGAGDPAKIVEKYITAKVTGDAKTVKQLLCSAMEAQADQEATTFLGTSEPKIESMACVKTADDKVKCDGKISALYGQEKNEFPLVTYKVVQEDGEWKYCGETK